MLLTLSFTKLQNGKSGAELRHGTDPEDKAKSEENSEYLTANTDHWKDGTLVK